MFTRTQITQWKTQLLERAAGVFETVRREDRIGGSEHQGSPAHQVFPYLLRNVVIDRPNHVWAADITYIQCAAVSFIYSRVSIGNA